MTDLTLQAFENPEEMRKEQAGIPKGSIEEILKPAPYEMRPGRHAQNETEYLRDPWYTRGCPKISSFKTAVNRYLGRFLYR